MNKKASVLMISLWILALLSIFAIGLGYRASLTLKVSRYQRDRLKAGYVARAGINRAIVVLDAIGDSSPQTLQDSWSTGLDVQGNDFLRTINFSKIGGTCVIEYLFDSDHTLCMIDEERKLNINNLDETDFSQLFKKRYIADADSLAKAVMKWRDRQEGLSELEKNIFKQEPFKSIEELYLVFEYYYKNNNGSKEDALDAFNKIKDIITVYGDNVNINTASADVLEILAAISAVKLDNDLSGRNYVEKSSAVAGSIKTFLAGDNNTPRFFSKKDAIINNLQEPEGISSESESILKDMVTKLDVTSFCFRIQAKSTVNNVTKKITAVYNRKDGVKKIVYWHES